MIYFYLIIISYCKIIKVFIYLIIFDFNYLKIKPNMKNSIKKLSHLLTVYVLHYCTVVSLLLYIHLYTYRVHIHTHTHTTNQKTASSDKHDLKSFETEGSTAKLTTLYSSLSTPQPSLLFQALSLHSTTSKLGLPLESESDFLRSFVDHICICTFTLLQYWGSIFYNLDLCLMPRMGDLLRTDANGSPFREPENLISQPSTFFGTHASKRDWPRTLFALIQGGLER